jgi:histidinol-phosphate aminotransferase
MTDHELPALDMNNKQVLRFRTFSKAYGLAGMRIGYVLGHPELVSGFNRIRNHFAVNKLAQIAAVASLEDTDILPSVLQQVTAGRQRIYDLAETLALPFLRSSTNFVTIDLGSSERAASLLKALNEEGIFLRKPMVPPQDSFIRIGVGTVDEHAILAEAFSRLVRA